MSRWLTSLGLKVLKKERLIFNKKHHQEQRLTWVLDIPCWTLDIVFLK